MSNRNTYETVAVIICPSPSVSSRIAKEPHPQVLFRYLDHTNMKKKQFCKTFHAKYSNGCIEIRRTIAAIAYMNQVKTVKVDNYGVTAPKTVPEGTVVWLPIEIELLMDGLWTPELNPATFPDLPFWRALHRQTAELTPDSKKINFIRFFLYLNDCIENELAKPVGWIVNYDQRHINTKDISFSRLMIDGGFEHTGDNGDENYFVYWLRLLWAIRPTCWRDCFGEILGMWPDLT